MRHQDRRKVLMPNGEWWVTIDWNPAMDSYVMAPEDTVLRTLPARDLGILKTLGYTKGLGE